MHEGNTNPRLKQELRSATDLALWATEVTALSLGKAMSTLVVQERHLWLSLAERSDIDKVRFLDVLVSQAGLFGDTVEDCAQQICPHSGGAQWCGRCTLTTAHFPRRMTTPSRDDPADLESIREAQVDLFASRESSHCQLYFSLTEGPLGTDALAHSWPRALCKYAFPPVSLLAQTLCKVREDEEQVLLVAPFWPTLTWFPELILLVTAPPWRIPLRKDLLSQGLSTIWHPRPDLWNLYVWLLDGTRQTWVVSHRLW